jgi:GntR family transcriptional regulator
VVSPHRKKDVLSLCGKNKEVIEFRYLPDMGSINIVKTALLELNKK